MVWLEMEDGERAGSPLFPPLFRPTFPLFSSDLTQKNLKSHTSQLHCCHNTNEAMRDDDAITISM